MNNGKILLKQNFCVQSFAMQIKTLFAKSALILMPFILSIPCARGLIHRVLFAVYNAVLERKTTTLTVEVFSVKIQYVRESIISTSLRDFSSCPMFFSVPWGCCFSYKVDLFLRLKGILDPQCLVR